MSIAVSNKWVLTFWLETGLATQFVPTHEKLDSCVVLATQRTIEEISQRYKKAFIKGLGRKLESDEGIYVTHQALSRYVENLMDRAQKINGGV